MIKSRLSVLLLCFPFLAATKCIDSAQSPGPGARDACASVTAAETPGAALGVMDTTLGKSDIAQSFTTVGSVTVSGANLRLSAFAPSTPTGASVVGGLTLRLQSDNAGMPVNDELAVGTLDAAQVTVGSAQSYVISFNAPVTLAAQRKYWLRLSANYAPNATSLIHWAASNSNPLKDGGAAYFEASSPALTNFNQWSTLKISDSRDLLFSLDCAAE